MLGQAFGLPLVEQEALKRQGHDYDGINPPEIGDFEDAIDELVYASPSPSLKKLITAPWQRLKSPRLIALTLDIGTPPRRLM